jgi:hypothetical protein
MTISRVKSKELGGESCSIAASTITNLTWSSPWLNWTLRDKKPAPQDMSCVSALLGFTFVPLEMTPTLKQFLIGN